MLFLEAPPSVGFSYCHRKECRWNDTTQAVANYGALVKFYQEFPVFAGRPFFITGESYGGMYVPTLVEQIHSRPAGKAGIELKGFAVGNGIIGHRDSFPGAAGSHYAFLHDKASKSMPRPPFPVYGICAQTFTSTFRTFVFSTGVHLGRALRRGARKVWG